MNLKMRLMGAAALGLMVSACATESTPMAPVAMATPRPMADPVMPAPTTRPATRVTNAREAQMSLAQRGYNPGPIDGRWGRSSMRAMMAFQRANNMPPTGRLTPATMAALSTMPMPMASSMAPMNPAPMMSPGMRMSQAPAAIDRDRSGVQTDADPGTGGTGGSGGSAGGPTSAARNVGAASAQSNRAERSGTGTDSEPGTGGTGGSGGGMGAQQPGGGVSTMRSPAGGAMERSGTATGADPGSGGTGGSGGGSATPPR